MDLLFVWNALQSFRKQTGMVRQIEYSPESEENIAQNAAENYGLGLSCKAPTRQRPALDATLASEASIADSWKLVSRGYRSQAD